MSGFLIAVWRGQTAYINHILEAFWETASKFQSLTMRVLLPYMTLMYGRAEPVLKHAEKQQTRPPVIARPMPHVDRIQLRAEINERFSKTLENLAR